MDAEGNALPIFIVLVAIGIFYGLWLAGSAYEIHRQCYVFMMSLLQDTYDSCMVAHTYDNHYPDCMKQVDAGLNSGLNVGWRESYVMAFDNNWFVKEFR